jgi:hypothetical protein
LIARISGKIIEEKNSEFQIQEFQMESDEKSGF